MNKKKRNTLLIIMILLIGLISVPMTLSYFTTYTRTKGPATLKLSDEIRFREDKVDGGKHVVLSVPEGGDPIYVRVRAFAVEEVAKYLEYNGSNWTKKGDWYEYDLPVREGQEAILDIVISEEGQTAITLDDFNIIVVYEFIPASVDDNGNLYADWDARWDITRIEG